MIKLLIADDEKYDRESINHILSLSFKDLLDIDEARNGREAIEISERLRPEIIIMDIKMPGINGLKAIEEIRKFLPNAYFIILTAYDYFDFAIEAVKNNVKGYILKPFSRNELTEKIKIGIDFINTEKERRKSEIENQEKLYNLIPVLENELSYSIINNTINLREYETYLRYLDISFNKACSIVMQSKEKIYDEEVKLQLGEYIKEYINRKYRAIGSYRFSKDFVYFIQINNLLDEYEARYQTVNLSAGIRREVKSTFNVSLKIGIGKCYSGLDLIHKSYEEAMSSLEYKSENVNIIHFEDIKNSLILSNAANEKFQNLEKKKIAVFKQVEQYITDNLKKELDLENTAARFNLSPYYFSRSFKEAMGYNFSDFINIARIKKAKELLKIDYMSIKEIGYSVGYSDPNYFSKVFKKYESISPTEFKEKLK
ncbi:response regulator [Candidatus Clostridium stratigraminis]|uniref:Stage 0 sporulation protein A homolog n=1 Tax=Candidatus Clostridium stratigraminis TaxID=3381661 RepID=A0ABW8T1I1_9CLOT